MIDKTMCHKENHNFNTTHNNGKTQTTIHPKFHTLLGDQEGPFPI